MNTELLRKVFELSRDLAKTHDVNTLLQLAMAQTLEIVKGEIGYLILVDDNGELAFQIQAGALVEEVVASEDMLSHTIFNEVLENGQAIVITDALSDSRYAAQSSIVALRLRSVMCVPLISKGKTMGAIYVENRKVSGAFREEDLEPLLLFANQAAVSIENAMIIANLEELVAKRTAEVERSWQEAVEANRIRTLFLGQLAHDMRTPATVIALSLNMLANPHGGSLSEKQHTWVTRALMAAEQMTNLITNVFELSKYELGSLELHALPTDLGDFLWKMVEIGKGLPWPEGVEFRMELAAPLPTLNIDPVRIQQVVMNLISNALKFTQQGEVVLYAHVPQPDCVEIGVRDTGQGIPLEAQQHVFERFQQFDNNSTRRVQGAGLGLAICRELVEKHGGRIWVNSAPDQGSDFVFRLPN